MLGDKRWLMVGDPSGLSMLVVFEGSRDVGALYSSMKLNNEWGGWAVIGVGDRQVIS